MPRMFQTILAVGLSIAGISLTAAAVAPAEESRAVASPAAAKAGYALLDQFVDTFQLIATKGKDNLEVEERLQAIMALARTDKDAGA